MLSSRPTNPGRAVSFWRDVRVLRVAGQVAFLGLCLLALYWLFSNFQANLSSSGLSFSFRFVNESAGFIVSDEGIPFSATDSNGTAFLIGVAYSLKVVLIGMLFATLIGTIIGISRLSRNWLLRKLAAIYIETLRNIPLPLQLAFWYLAVILNAFPRVQESIQLPGPIFLNNRGVNLPWPVRTEAFEPWTTFLLIGLVVAVVIYFARRAQLKAADRPGFPLGWATAGFLGIAALGWAVSLQSPLVWEYPALARFNFQGGLALSASFFAIMMGLSLYTAAFIAEVVRAGIQSVHRGQTEAAKASGLSQFQILRLVIIPQAMRVIIPPLTSQYLNLSKNSSLGILVGYPDLFSVGNTIFNQTGRAPEMILLMMAAYLSLSLVTSLLMNIYNKKMRLVER